MFSETRKALLIALVLCGAPLVSAYADEHEGEGAHEGGLEYHPNMLGFFLGHTFEGRLETFALGIEYERRVSRTFGIGVFAEYVTDDVDFFVYGVPFAYHNGRFKTYLAPGVEDSSEEGTEFMLRVGAEYGFEVGEWEISPQLNLDYVDKEGGWEGTWVLGVLIGKGF